MISAATGGLGLFLLGMWLMTAGLKSAAGTTLHNLLQHWTRTPIRGLSVGFFLTALVQSSGAVSVATIGFTDAGLLKLKRAVWVIFGSNIGTTVTGWLVALIGFNFKISAFALPLIGIGMLLKLIYQDRNPSHFGQALVGFGVLFLGIDVMKDTFSGLGEQFQLLSETDPSFLDLLSYIGIGFVITTLMQSSSVALAITLTALAGGVVGLPAAAGVVIGSNLGSTTTAIFSSIGAGSAAKRVVASHVLFNIITTIVTLFILSPLLMSVIYLQEVFTDQTLQTTTLALFHTSFNVLGVLLMWPITSHLVTWLSKHFVTLEEDEGKTQYLHKNALSVPSLAVHALSMELERLGHYVLAMAKDSINFENRNSQFSRRRHAVANRILSIGEYTSRFYQQNLSETIANQLPVMLRISRYYDAISELSTLVNEHKTRLSTLNEELQSAINNFCLSSITLLKMTDLQHAKQTTVEEENEVTQTLQNIESDYQTLKALLLRRGTEGKLSINMMEQEMALISEIRRINQQAVKAFQHYLSVTQNVDIDEINSMENLSETTSV